MLIISTLGSNRVSLHVLAVGVKYWNKLGSRWPMQDFLHSDPKVPKKENNRSLSCSSHRHLPPCLFQYFTPRVVHGPRAGKTNCRASPGSGGGLQDGFVVQREPVVCWLGSCQLLKLSQVWSYACLWWQFAEKKATSIWRLEHRTGTVLAQHSTSSAASLPFFFDPRIAPTPPTTTATR